MFLTRLLRVPTPFSLLNRASHSPALVHPEALHFSETFSLGIQIKITHMRIQYLMLLSP